MASCRICRICLAQGSRTGHSLLLLSTHLSGKFQGSKLKGNPGVPTYGSSNMLGSDTTKAAVGSLIDARPLQLPAPRCGGVPGQLMPACLALCPHQNDAPPLAIPPLRSSYWHPAPEQEHMESLLPLFQGQGLV